MPSLILRMGDSSVLKTHIAGLLLVAFSGSAHAAEWETGRWEPAIGRGGLCQMDETGEAKRMEARVTACSINGAKVREEDCDAASKPELMRWSKCSMTYACAGWHDEAYAEGARDRREVWSPARSSKVAAMVSCVNAKEADPTIIGCRSSKVDRAVETMKSVPSAMVTNHNYAWITCNKAAG